MRLVVMLDDDRMVDRDIPGTLFEVIHRIAARFHDVAEECVGKGDRAGGIVHETRLHVGSAVQELPAFCGLERPDVQLLDALLTLLEIGLRL